MTRRRWIADEFTEDTASLSGSQAAHLIRVLRVRRGMQYDIVAGDRVRRGTVTDACDDRVFFSLHEQVEAEAPLPLTLVLAVFKFDRLEWAIEKATELGIQSVAPVIAKRTEKHLAESAGKRVERWRRIALEAAQQSRRSQVPAIATPQTLKEFLSGRPQDARRILMDETERVVMLQDRLSAVSESVEIAVGPEGGWTDEEITLFHEKGWHSASLGPRILRAETAAIASVAIAAGRLESS